MNKPQQYQYIGSKYKYTSHKATGAVCIFGILQFKYKCDPILSSWNKQMIYLTYHDIEMLMTYAKHDTNCCHLALCLIET